MNLMKFVTCNSVAVHIMVKTTYHNMIKVKVLVLLKQREQQSITNNHVKEQFTKSGKRILS